MFCEATGGKGRSVGSSSRPRRKTQLPLSQQAFNRTIFPSPPKERSTSTGAVEILVTTCTGSPSRRVLARNATPRRPGVDAAPPRGGHGLDVVRDPVLQLAEDRPEVGLAEERLEEGLPVLQGALHATQMRLRGNDLCLQRIQLSHLALEPLGARGL